MTKINKCPICKNIHISYLPGKNAYSFCEDCHTAFKKNILTGNYSKEYYLGSSKVATRILSKFYDLFYFERRRLISKKLQLWIDVGAGDGNFLQTVSAKKKIGVEISSSGKLMMQKKSIDVLTPNQFLKSKKLNADIISFWHSLEHIDNPQKYILSSFKNLNKNGSLIIGIPNIDSLEFAFFKDNWFHLAPKYHLWHFSPFSITCLLNDCGFIVKKIDYFSFEHHFAGLIQSVINKTSGSSNILHKLFKRRSDLSSISFKDKFWCIFWLTFGLPFLVLFFFIAVFIKRSGTIIVLAEKNNILTLRETQGQS